jgi:hypothetical protein
MLFGGESHKPSALSWDTNSSISHHTNHGDAITMLWGEGLADPFIALFTFGESRFVYFQEDPFAGPVEVEVKDGVYLHFHSLHVMDMEVCCTKAIL